VSEHPKPTSDFCVECDTHLAEFCCWCHGKLEKQRDEARKYASDLAAWHPHSAVGYLRLIKTEQQRDDALRALASICDSFERTIAHAEWRNGGSKGMSVTFTGEFASAAQLPSLVDAMRRCVKDFRRVLGPKEEE